ncbi:hypothetical protein SORDD15_01008 [Streptococcus oralis]|uniref:Uncharacterized protein n=1 Tax=Streptococcus oralis TaxID=1303 RepID=A0A139NYY7_STROR|nr:hypothetical protein SORDD15_01008 [Streptococcus oralis]
MRSSFVISQSIKTFISDLRISISYCLVAYFPNPNQKTDDK